MDNYSIRYVYITCGALVAVWSFADQIWHHDNTSYYHNLLSSLSHM